MEAKKLESGSGEISFKGRRYHIGKIRKEWWGGRCWLKKSSNRKESKGMGR